MIYQDENYFDDGTLGAWYDSILGGGVSTGTGLLVSWLRDRQQPSGRNCLQGQVSGDEAMTNCVPRVMQLFNELETLAPQMSPFEVIAQANQIAFIFEDNLYFDQSIGGRSAEIREAAKIAGRQRADQIIAQAQAAIDAATQQAATQQGGATTVGGITIDTKTVLIAGGGLMLLLWLMKN